MIRNEKGNKIAEFVERSKKMEKIAMKNSCQQRKRVV